MLIHLLFYCALSIYASSGLKIVNPGPQIIPTNGEVWPKPQFQKKEDNYYKYNPSLFSTKITNVTCDILSAAVERYGFIIRNTNNLQRLRPKHQPKRRKRVPTSEIAADIDVFFKGRIEELEIELNRPCESYPYFNMDETYDLVVAAKSKLSSVSIWGILRGLETWTQLFYFSSDYNELRINETHIIDFPRYPHRGLLVDTSRHFVSLSNILKTLDAMAMNKMNVFHWHIVDDQSFPYQSEVFPDLSAKGAYHPSLVYSKEDIELVVKYARDRGIRVLPEFDVPGHTRSWGVAYPNVLTKCYNHRGNVIGLGPMDPTRNTTYKLLQDLIQEVQQWFPDKYFHVGGDEVELDCWQSNPDLRKYMKDHNMTTAQLHGMFMENVIPLLGDRSSPIVWQEVFDEGVPLSKDTIIQIWKWNWVNDMISVLRSGHRLIFSSSWYLDHLKSGGDWTDFYMADPREMVSAAANTTLLDNIVGGEACMWGEVVDDSNVISRVWPRASAVAERLWSPAMDSGYRAYFDALDEAKHRIEEHTCRMRRRGIHAQPPNGPGVCVGGAS